MNVKTFFTTYKYDIWKLIGVTVLFSFALTVKVETIGETDEVVQFDYVAEIPHSSDDSVADESESKELLEGQEHGIADSFFSLCEKHPIICKKTFFNGTFGEREKTDYFEQITSIVSKIDDTARRGSYLEEVFTAILVNQVKGSRRGSSGRTKLTMNLGGLKYADEFWQVFTHEVGHIMDLGALQGKSKTKNVVFTEFGKKNFAIDDPSLEYYRYSRTSETIRKSGVKKQDFCSGYGMSDPFEDFAECHNLYLNHHNLFQFLAQNVNSLKNKYNYFANLYGGKYFSDSSLSLREIQADWRAWDTTRIQE